MLLTYCNSKYYGEFDSTSLLYDIQKNVDPSIININKEFMYVFYRIMHTEPGSYWDKNIYQQTILLLENLYQSYNQNLNINEDIFNYFVMGYNAYCQISETMSDLSNFNISFELKTRLYRLPTYTSILESCLANFLRVIATLTGQGVGKDYSKQSTLGKLVDVMNSNGYNAITSNIDVNIRNSINHGKVVLIKDPADKIKFFYNEQGVSKSKEIPLYEFDNMINLSFDTASAVLLALIVFMNNHISLINIDESKNEYVPFAILAMRLSIPGIYCQSISDTGNTNQINIELEVEETDRGYIASIASLLSILVYYSHPDYEKYLFSFSHPRMQSGWIIYHKQDILDMISNTKGFDDVCKEIIERKEFMIFPPSTEDIDLNEVKYFCFPNFTTSEYKINNIANASTLDRKRLRANLFIGEVNERSQILNIIEQAIGKLITVKTPASPKFEEKHGDMPADSLYINVYRTDGRKHKEIIASNENFICFVDYNIDGTTTLVNGGMLPMVWNSLHHEKLNNLLIAWRTGEYTTIVTWKIGRNDPCPCGSKRKYKKCCGK